MGNGEAFNRETSKVRFLLSPFEKKEKRNYFSLLLMRETERNVQKLCQAPSTVSRALEASKMGSVCGTHGFLYYFLNKLILDY